MTNSQATNSLTWSNNSNGIFSNSKTISFASNHSHQIQFSNFDGASEKQILKAFSQYGDIRNANLFRNANHEPIGRGTIEYDSEIPCLKAIKVPPLFNGKAVSVVLATPRENPCLNEITDSDNYMSLYVQYKNQSNENESNIESLKNKLTNIEADVGLSNIQILNNIVIPAYDFLNAYILNYFTHVDAESAFDKLKLNNINCRPSTLWG